MIYSCAAYSRRLSGEGTCLARVEGAILFLRFRKRWLDLFYFFVMVFAKEMRRVIRQTSLLAETLLLVVTSKNLG